MMHPHQTIRLDSICVPSFLVSPIVEWLHAIDLVVMVDGWGEGFAPWVSDTRESISQDRFETLAACNVVIRWESLLSTLWSEGRLAEGFPWLIECLQGLEEGAFLSLVDEDLRALVGRSVSVTARTTVKKLLACSGVIMDEPESIARLAGELLQDPARLKRTYIDTIEAFLESDLRSEWVRNAPILEEEVSRQRQDVRPAPLPAVIERLTGRSVTLDACFSGEYDHLLAVPTTLLGPHITLSRLPGEERRLLLIYGIQPNRSVGDAAVEARSTARAAGGFKALGEETRLRILLLLAEREMYAHEIGLHFANLGQPAISRHLRYLVSEGILDFRDSQAKKYYSLNRSRIRALEEELNGLATRASSPAEPTLERGTE